VKQAGKSALTEAAPRPLANENYLLINAFAPQPESPLVAVTRRISECGCNVVDARVSTLGSDVSVLALAVGPWDAIAKLENALNKLERGENLRITHFRTGPKPVQNTLLPEFFSRRGITIEQLHSSRYRAMQTGADMFSAQVTVGIPSTTHIAALRDDFLEFCDGLNLDAIMDPMKF
jgi:glycine cleavage system transcriptional repressor